MQMKAYMGNEDRKHNNGLLRMNSSHPTGSAAGCQNAAPVAGEIGIYWRRSYLKKGDSGMYVLKYCEFLTSNVDLANIYHDAMAFF
ncbi:unnamed protein product [Prunus armeniaca]|uniref:Uncharacterized protein n=1 Tax=Prunus armeniaca TaxID=36596 RepID=A0A6J5UC14_PRUAR|nr:unnamed protein product [Prunus armeniaca]